MNAVTYGVARTRTATIGSKSTKAKPYITFFARFMDALMETRRREASRVIENHAHLLASTEILSKKSHEKR